MQPQYIPSDAGIEQACIFFLKYVDEGISEFNVVFNSYEESTALKNKILKYFDGIKNDFILDTTRTSMNKLTFSSQLQKKDLVLHCHNRRDYDYYKSRNKIPKAFEVRIHE